jgi:Holliday junction resolvase RusA-like endonuclease
VSYKLQIVFPWPPTANHCYVTTRQGRRVLTAGAKSYQGEATSRTAFAVNCTPAEYWVKKPDLFVVEATYYKPDRRRRDTDNVRKVLADAVAAGLGVDDSQFMWRDQDLQVDREDPRVELTIFPKES